MICEQPGHLIHSPSGTRLAFAFVGAIGVRAFLNQAMKGQLIKNKHSLVLSPLALVLGPSLVLGRPWSFVLGLGVGCGTDQRPRTKHQGRPRTKNGPGTKNQGPRTISSVARSTAFPAPFRRLV